MTVKKLKPGMKVDRVRRSSGLATFNGKWQTWSVYVKEIDEENERVLAQCVGPERWYDKREWSKWRLNIPK